MNLVIMMNSNAGGLYMLDKILGNYDAIEREAEASHEIIKMLKSEVVILLHHK